MRKAFRRIAVAIGTAASLSVLAASTAGAQPVAPTSPLAAPKPALDAEPAQHPLGWEAFRPWATSPSGFSIAGYLQAQYEAHQDSRNQLFQGGTLQNKDRFDIRRARLSVSGDWQFAALAIELDANTVNGAQVDLRKAEASLQYRPDRQRPPLLMATLGLFDTPFGYELVEVPRTRWFLEQATVTRELWPGAADLGLRLAGALGFFRWTIAALNGHPAGEASNYSLQDPIGWKDVVFRFGVDSNPRSNFHIAGGISSMKGKGFHAGSDATKASVQWSDTNRDGVIQPTELVGVPAQSALASQTFERSALGADVRAHLRTAWGVTKLYAEVFVASNLDRGLFVADPVTTGVEQHELGYIVGLVQELGRHAVLGFRYDAYNPSSNAFDSRRARLLPYDQTISTYAPLEGLTLPERARLSLEYDFVRNKLARDERGVPASLKMNTWAVRLQVQL